MKNPFEKQEIKLNLSIRQLELLLKILSSSIPDGESEQAVLVIHYELSAKLDELRK